MATSNITLLGSSIVTLSGTYTYASAWRFQYVLIGKVCVFSFYIVPNQNISTAIGNIPVSGLPTPIGIPHYIISKQTLTDLTTADYGRYIAIASGTIRVMGAFSSGTAYTASGAYLVP